MTKARTPLTEANDGSSVTLHKGDILPIHLHENASTGYRWSVDAFDRSVISAKEDGYDGNAQSVGSGGTAKWIVEAIGPGTTQFKLTLSRPWEGDGSVLKRFAITLTIEH